jgi:thiol-disulfide isomerase/thioredoxin
VAATSLALLTSARAEEPPLATLRRDVTVVAFWASWCPPCLLELTQLESLQRRFASDGGVRIVAVSVDDRPRQAAARQRFAAERLTMPLVVDGRALYERYFPRSELTVPRLVVVDRRDRGIATDGFDADAATEDFVRELGRAIALVRAGKRSPPRGWHLLR